MLATLCLLLVAVFMPLPTTAIGLPVSTALQLLNDAVRRIMEATTFCLLPQGFAHTRAQFL
jgi:hypothetical protein